MKIGIDARLINETGVGRYIRNLIRWLSVLDTTHSYVVFLMDDAYEQFSLPNARWQKRQVSVRWHTLAEQFVMPWLFVKEHFDLVHVPYFNIPIFYPGKLIVTIHDLTILHFDTGKATTLPWPLYKLRRLGYYLVLAVGLVRAVRIIAVSKDVKKEIIDHFHISSEKIVVTYEGVEKMIPKGEPFISDPYFLYVGNAYPHKNLETLIRAFQKLISQGLALPFEKLRVNRKARPYENFRLVLVGKDDFFYQRLKQLVADLHLSDRIIFFGQASDGELANLYKYAIALVFPSRMEGFGLPGLEAMVHGMPVVCSDIPVFHEIYGDAALFVNTNNPQYLTSALEKISSDQSLRKHLITKGKIQAERFRWHEMAMQTLMAYNTTGY